MLRPRRVGKFLGVNCGCSSLTGDLDRLARVKLKLSKSLEAHFVDVIDESHLHVGHKGAASGGSHFRVIVVSSRFEGLGRVASQRLVYSSLEGEIGSSIHALAIKTYTPDEWLSVKAKDRQPSTPLGER